MQSFCSSIVYITAVEIIDEHGKGVYGSSMVQGVIMAVPPQSIDLARCFTASTESVQRKRLGDSSCNTGDMAELQCICRPAVRCASQAA